MTGQIATENALKFILSSNGNGNTAFSLKSVTTGTHFTYKVKLAPSEDESKPDCWFVSFLNGPDNWENYQYLGIIRENAFRVTAKSRAGADSPVAKAMAWTFAKLVAGEDISSSVEVWHEGKCGRCGKKLTVPESIASGYGPECMGKVGL